MKKILVFAASMNLGGITSFTIPLVNVLCEVGKVTFAYSCDECNCLSELLPEVHIVKYEGPTKIRTAIYMMTHGNLPDLIKIKFRNHNKISPISSVQRMSFAQMKVTKLPKELQKDFDMVISTSEFYCNNMVVFKLKGKNKMGWIHPDYKSLNPDVLFDRKTLDHLDFIATVSESNRQSLLDTISNYKGKVFSVPNLIDGQHINELAKEKPKEYENYDGKIIVTVARIDNSSKRLDRIVDACVKMKNDTQKFHWFIVGDGKDRIILESKIIEKKVDDVLTVLGGRNNPYPYVNYADVFVLVSQYEGRPIAVDEAMILGCPVIVTDYEAAKEQVGGYGDIISNDDKKCSEEICQLMQELTVREKNICNNHGNVQNKNKTLVLDLFSSIL